MEYSWPRNNRFEPGDVFFQLTHEVQTCVVQRSNLPTVATGGFSTVQQVDTPDPYVVQRSTVHWIVLL